MIAIGIGCRKGCGADEIVQLVRRACAGLGPRTPWFAGEEGEPGDPRSGVRLFTIAEKQGETGLIEAAVTLALPLVFLPQAALAAVERQVETRSARVIALFGTPSVAEAAALAGAGTGARLLVPRLASASATCAIAISEVPS